MADQLNALTTTSYAILLLLSLRGWTTYELAQQMKRSLHWFWPRAESKLYEEPKKLVAHGLARSQRRYSGRRPTTLYEITPAGRQALSAWVRRPGNSAPVLEFEALLRVFAADSVDPDDVRRTLEDVRVEMEAWRELGDGIGASIAGPAAPFPQRTHINALIHRLLSLYIDAVHEWADWALDEVAKWPDTALDAPKLRRARKTLLTPIAEAADAAKRDRDARYGVRPRKPAKRS